jgi:hypothetical protein
MGVYNQQQYPINLLSHDDEPDWKVVRYPFTDVGPEVLAEMHPGYLVKFNAARDAVLPALAADDATLEAVIVDTPERDSGDTTVAVALQGSFNANQVHYADAHAATGGPAPLSPAAITRLREVGIFLDEAVPGGAFAP